MVNRGGAAWAGMVGVRSLVGNVARVDFFAYDAADDCGRCTAGLLHVLTVNAAVGMGGTYFVGADSTSGGRRSRAWGAAASASRAAGLHATEPGTA